MQGVGFAPRLVAVQGFAAFESPSTGVPLPDWGMFGGSHGHRKRVPPKRRKNTRVDELEFLLME
jgi:hypothetical protein